MNLHSKINAVVFLLTRLIQIAHNNCLSTKGVAFKEYQSMYVNMTPFSVFQIMNSLECLLACENDARCNSLNLKRSHSNRVICELLAGNRETAKAVKSEMSSHHEIMTKVQEKIDATTKPYCQPECHYVPSCKADRAASCRCLNRMMFSMNKGHIFVVGPSGNQYARILVDIPSGLYQLKLVSSTGFISCNGFGDPSRLTNFGCISMTGDDEIMMIVTDNKNSQLLPGPRGYSHDGRASKSDYLTFNDQVQLTQGQEIRIWYRDDLNDNSESDNVGLTYFYVAAIRADKGSS
ncbi:uncharacterized protein LOC135682654 isoform X2 [Rhopilema esculentum]|uniref:uncharacterized protein LOC135682654 isoform X2 n=1 Tax=Rhopilema esculentum TaxID=499914 RepID=UPI0031DD5864|eukprot:gene14616-5694_t